ncbi:MAG: hypothetical protein L0H03_15890, partial [Rhodococcus sp. (in: high G+C Gram-positive bacteria)]|nr:hypothetical protein [Rhodococcus sp. (in: high G+C Gram-positive bacteria)]
CFALAESTQDELANLDNIDDFLSSKCFSLLSDASFDMEKAGKLFCDTFNVIEGALGEESFKRFDKASNKFKGAFSVSAFEAITTGVSSNIIEWQALTSTPDGQRTLRSKGPFRI